MKVKTTLMIAVCFMIMVFVGCASTPAYLNTSGIQRIAVKPFEVPEIRQLGIRVLGVEARCKVAAEYLTSVISEKIEESSNFTLVDESLADAILTGQVTNVSFEDNESRTTVAGATMTLTYSKWVRIWVTYNLYSTQDGRLIDSTKKKYSKIVTEKNVRPDNNEAIRQTIDKEMPSILEMLTQKR